MRAQKEAKTLNTAAEGQDGDQLSTIMSPKRVPGQKGPKSCLWPRSNGGEPPWGGCRRWPRKLPPTLVEVATKAAAEARRAAWKAAAPERARKKAERDLRRQAKKRTLERTTSRILRESDRNEAAILAALERDAARHKRRKRPKSNAEQQAEIDTEARRRLKLTEDEEKENAKHLRRNSPIGAEASRSKRGDTEWEDPSVPGKFSDERAQRVLSAADIDTATGITATVWTDEIVGNRLIEAYQVLGRMPIRTMPSTFNNSMPSILYDENDRKGWGSLRGKADSDRNRVRLAATAAEIQRMEKAFLWPIRLLRLDKFRQATFRWAQWRAERRNLRVMCKRFEFSYETFMRRRKIGLLAIAYELNRLKEPVIIGAVARTRARRHERKPPRAENTQRTPRVRIMKRGQFVDLS